MQKNDKKIPGKRRRRCEICGNLKYGVANIINPYDEDVRNLKHKQLICQECFNILKKEI